MTYAHDKLKEIFENTIESDLRFEGDLSNIDYYSLFCKAAANNKLFKLLGNNLCMFNCTYKDSDAILLIYFIPINSEESGAKTIAERVIEIIDVAETCFVTLDHINSEEVKEEKFIYVTIVKKLK